MNISNYENYVKYEDKYQKIEDCLETIPSDASVGSDPNFLPHVAERDEVYSIDSSNFVFSGSNVVSVKDINETDYIVLNMTDSSQVQVSEILKSRGYTVFAEVKDQIIILARGEKP